MRSKLWLLTLVSAMLSATYARFLAAEESIESLAGSATLSADVVLYTGDLDRPRFVVINRSEPEIAITGFDLSVGDTQFNFDFVGVLDIAADSGFSVLSSVPDMNDSGGERSDAALVQFSGFGGGSAAIVTTELDEDSGDSFVSFRSIFFNNGAAPNAELTLEFTRGDSSLAVTKLLSDELIEADAADPTIEFRAEFDDSDPGVELPVADVIVPARQNRRLQLIDGSIAATSRWANSGETWFELVLAEPASISGLELAPRIKRAYRLDVFIDEMHVTTLTTRSTADIELQKFDLPVAVTGSTIRVEVINNNWIKFHEAKVLGELP